MALWLGRGWYVRGHPGVVYDGPMARAQFEIALPAGKAVKLTTDATWKAKASPITPLGKGTAFGDYGGERYDARQEVSGWDSVKLDDSPWEAAGEFDPPKVRTSAQMVEPNRAMETLKPSKIEATPAGGWLIDMGKNYTGWLELACGGHRGGKESEDRIRRQSSRRRPVCNVQSARRVHHAGGRWPGDALAIQLSRLPLRSRDWT